MTIYGYLFAFYDDGPFEAESQQSLRITILQYQTIMKIRIEWAKLPN